MRLFTLKNLKTVKSSFGIGKESKFYYTILRESGIIPDILTSNSKKSNISYFYNIPVAAPETLLNDHEKYYFIITIENTEFINQVRKQLLHWGVKDFAIITHDFLCDFDQAKNKGLKNSFYKAFNNVYENVDFSLNNFNDARWLYTHSISMWFFCSDWIITKYTGKENVSLLAVGPGAGLASLIYKDLLNCSLDWISLENPHKVYQVSKQKELIENNSINIKYGHIETDNFSGEKYDIIVFTELLEHMVYCPINTLKKLRNMLKPGGNLVLTTPKQRDASSGYLRGWQYLLS